MNFEIDNAILIEHPEEGVPLLYLRGWAFAEDARLLSVRVCHGLSASNVPDVGLPRADVYHHHPNENSHLSGFEGLLFLENADPCDGPNANIEITFNDGTCKSVGLQSVIQRKASLPLSEEARDRLDAVAADPPEIAICMTTYNPPIDLFRRQIESLKSQTRRDWICIVCDDCSATSAFIEIRELVKDDARFIVLRNTERLNITSNFEHALKHVPTGCKYVAFADQDDRWQPDKLEKLAAVLDSKPAVELVYSDMRIVDESGKVIAPTYWTSRRNSYTDLVSLFLANTVTGAASMFRRSLLDLALPFPYAPGRIYHDHWMACVALAKSAIDYIDEPLYDYVQHTDQNIGHAVSKWPALLRDTGLLLQVLDALGEPRLYQGRYEASYYCDVIRLRLMAATLIARATGGKLNLAAGRLVQLRKIANLGAGLSDALFLFGRALKRFGRRSETIGAELYLLRAVAWRYAKIHPTVLLPMRFMRWLGRRLLLPVMARLNLVPGSSLVQRTASPLTAKGYYEFAVSSVRSLMEKIEPLTLRIGDRKPQVNFLIPTLDPNVVFGGYLSKFNLIRGLIKSGIDVRLVVVDWSPTDLEEVKQNMRRFPIVGEILDNMEVFFAYGRKVPLPVSQNDVFIATTWWTAQIAHAACRRLESQGLVYFIQEFEPALFPFGSHYALALETYDFSHVAVFSTDLLRQFFQHRKLGVYAESPAPRLRQWTSIRPAITNVRAPDVDKLARRISRRILFYARPEDHAARNLFELGVLSINRAIEDELLGPHWEFWGIGGFGGKETLPLAKGHSLHMVPRMSQEKYAAFLQDYDVGICLMYAPHPSLVPLDMARAGMVTLTTEFENKTAAELSQISGNIIAVPASVAALANGVGRAVRLAEDPVRRVTESNFDWPITWDETFGDQVMAGIEEGIALCRNSYSARPDHGD